jgi:hypothetical protein
MIALLFALLALCVVLALLDLSRISYGIFGACFLLSLYWFGHHATSVIGLQL